MTHANFIALCNDVSDDTVKSLVKVLSDEITARAEYEQRKNSDNDKIQKTLSNVHSKLVRSKAAKLHAVANVNASYINRCERVNAKYNVYALQKIADIVDVVMFEQSMNKINYHVLRSLFRFEAKELTFTHRDAVCAASDKCKVEDAKKRSALSRHNVSETTASTQASSTMNALVTLGVVSETNNADNVSCYVLTHSPLCEALKEIVMK